jgi:hypothetical protein
MMIRLLKCNVHNFKNADFGFERQLTSRAIARISHSHINSRYTQNTIQKYAWQFSCSIGRYCGQFAMGDGMLIIPGKLRTQDGIV